MLEELGLHYAPELLPFPPRYRSPDFLELNPLGTIPLFLDGDVRMTESTAICQYLAACTAIGTRLIDSERRCAVTMISWLVASGTPRALSSAGGCWANAGVVVAVAMTEQHV